MRLELLQGPRGAYPSMPLPGQSVSLDKEAMARCQHHGLSPIAIPTLPSRKWNRQKQ